MQSFSWILAFLGCIQGENFVLQEKNTLLISEYEWKFLDYLWDSREQRDRYIFQGLYRPEAMVPRDVDRAPDGRAFLTVSRSPGVPASLHTISVIFGDSGPLLIPYPDWSTYENPEKCTGIISVFRITIDRCNRLWVLDDGKIDNHRICPARLLVYDLSTDELITSIEIPNEIAQNQLGQSLLVIPVIETSKDNKCGDDVTVYIADMNGRGLIIWRKDRFLRLENELFDPEPQNADFTIVGETLHLLEGMYSLALTPERYFNGNRYLFFKPLASRSLYAVLTNDLKFKSRDHDKIRYYGSIDIFSSQATAMSFSDDGTLFYGLAEDTAIGCWNLKRPLESNNMDMPLVDEERLQFVSALKIIKNRHSRQPQNEQLLLMTNRLQKIRNGTMNFDEINFRVMSVNAKKLVQDTVCDYDL